MPKTTPVNARLDPELIKKMRREFPAATIPAIIRLIVAERYGKIEKNDEGREGK